MYCVSIPFAITKDGIESQLQTNSVETLTRATAGLSLIVNLSWGGSLAGDRNRKALPFDSIGDESRVRSWGWYAQSELAALQTPA